MSDAMPERTRPLDAIGNEIRKGQLCNLRFPDQGVICRAVDVVRAGTMHDAEGKAMKLQGSVTFMVQLPYAEGQGLPQALCLKEPEKQ